MKRFNRSPRGTSLSRGWSLLLLFLALPCGLCVASAQPYFIDWYKVAGGGGISSNAQFTVNGTIGQPEAGAPLANAVYSVSGGFWSMSTIATAGAPRLRILLTATNTAVIAWPSPSAGFSLQVTTNLAGAIWSTPAEIVNDNSAEKFIILNAPAGNRFYRLSTP